MKQVEILLFFLLISFYGNSQLGYLGNRYGIEFGVATNYSAIKNVRQFHNHSTDDDLLPPKLSFGIHKENKRGTIVHWQTMYNQLPNSRINSYKITTSGTDKVYDIDTAWTQSNNLQFSLGYRKFRELAPLGLYFECQFKGNIVFNKTRYRSENRVDFVGYNYFESGVKYATSSNTSFIPEAGLALGSTYPLNDLMILDFGGKFNLIFGKFRDKDGDISQIPNSTTFHKILSSRKLFTSNFLEFYVNIILFP